MLRVFMGEGDAYALLAGAVRQVWGMEALPEISRLPGGKPVFSRCPDRHFSLSHSGSLVLCALSDHPVGADIEVIRPRSEKLPAYVYKGAEYDRFLALGGGWDAFYTLWTETESILKYTGEGLKALRRADLPAGCILSNLSGQGWKGAVCGHERAARFETMPRRYAEWVSTPPG
ncbi:MAG: 4'-phosphopantetheinyl transferase family protein [Oscillospiraceae bacterium]